MCASDQCSSFLMRVSLATKSSFSYLDTGLRLGPLPRHSPRQLLISKSQFCIVSSKSLSSFSLCRQKNFSATKFQGEWVATMTK